MSEIEDNYYKIKNDPETRETSLSWVAEDFILELKDEIRQKDELILKLERKGY